MAYAKIVDTETLVVIPDEVYQDQDAWDGEVFEAVLDGEPVQVRLEGQAYGLGTPGCGDPKVSLVEDDDEDDPDPVGEFLADQTAEWSSSLSPEAVKTLHERLAGAEDLPGAFRAFCWGLDSSAGWREELYWSVGWVVTRGPDADPWRRCRTRPEAREEAERIAEDGEQASVWAPGAILVRQPAPGRVEEFEAR
jgi:hypothetical protein